MNFITKFSKKNIASESLFRQIIGALIEWNPKSFWLFVLVIAPVIVGVSLLLSPNDYKPLVWSLVLTLAVWLSIKVCRTLTKVFSLRKQETSITWCQISILIAIIVWILGFLLIFDIQNKPRFAAAFGIGGTLAGWIFQDKIKGVLAFLHLRLHHLLSIGDWIVVPKYNVDGVVERITLTTVTLYNWDTTTSTIPISALHSDHFSNFQPMSDGKTFGRKMVKSFIFDTSWFYHLSKEEADNLKQNKDITDFLAVEEINEGVLNAQLFRQYLFHWLMNQPSISQQPYLVVRWMEQSESGMPLQVQAFITDSGLVSFEWKQSQIIEHVMESMEWFGLRLYQSPSAYDVSNKNIHITDQSATYRKEVNHG